jgi:hypothetical protein
VVCRPFCSPVRGTTPRGGWGVVRSFSPLEAMARALYAVSQCELSRRQAASYCETAAVLLAWFTLDPLPA